MVIFDIHRITPRRAWPLRSKLCVDAQRSTAKV
jgi:hypothetical protein